MTKKIVIHIVPSFDVGGVEVAIIRSYNLISELYDYRLFYVRRKGALSCDQKPIWELFFSIVFKRLRPSCVITSLWWAHPFGALLKFTGIPWMAFFHNSGYSHPLDRFVLRWAWGKATSRIVDSSATFESMRSVSEKRAAVVPYIFPINDIISPWESRNIDFVWVGRSSSVKRLDLLVRFLKCVQSYFAFARVLIIISGTLPLDLKNFLKVTTLQVHVEYSLANNEVLHALNNSRFYLLFSDHEGMSMSTVEAVQSGCIPVVRRVGEISRYLKTDSCIDIKDDTHESIFESVQMVRVLWSDMAAVEKMRSCAKDSLKQFGNYSPSLISAIKSSLN